MSEWIQKLKQKLEAFGEGRVSDREEDLLANSGDKWFATGRPEVVVYPESTEEVVQVMKFSKEHDVVVTTRGAGVGYVGGCVPVKGGIVLSMIRMKRILEINVEDGVAVVEPGVITGDLQDAVRALGWFYPPDPASIRECSIGGNIATNAGGPHCLKYGVTRPYVLGLEVVLADGTVVQAGGRTHKNKSGFDLVGIFVGSEGMLGVVTKAILRIIPHPPTRSAVSVGFADMRLAAAAVQKVFSGGFLPSALEIADAFTLQAARNYLGADSIPEGDAHLIVEIDGHEESVASEIQKLVRIVQDAGGIKPTVAQGDQACEAFWKMRREYSYSLRATGLIKLNEDITVPRSCLVPLIELAERLYKESGHAVACFGHAGDGNIHVNIMVDGYEDPEVRKQVEGVLDQLFEQVVKWGGAISGEHGIGIAKKRWWAKLAATGVEDLHQRLKWALDPEDRLNPGKFIEKSD